MCCWIWYHIDHNKTGADHHDNPKTRFCRSSRNRPEPGRSLKGPWSSIAVPGSVSSSTSSQWSIVIFHHCQHRYHYYQLSLSSSPSSGRSHRHIHCYRRNVETAESQRWNENHINSDHFDIFIKTYDGNNSFDNESGNNEGDNNHFICENGFEDSRMLMIWNSGEINILSFLSYIRHQRACLVQVNYRDYP